VDLSTLVCCECHTPTSDFYWVKRYKAKAYKSPAVERVLCKGCYEALIRGEQWAHSSGSDGTPGERAKHIILQL